MVDVVDDDDDHDQVVVDDVVVVGVAGGGGDVVVRDVRRHCDEFILVSRVKGVNFHELLLSSFTHALSKKTLGQVMRNLFSISRYVYVYI